MSVERQIVPARSGYPGNVRRVAIVTTRTISDNPRVVKEADALAAAGHHVRVVAFGAATAEGVARDESTMHGKRWRLQAISVARAGATGTARWLWRTLVERAARQLVRFGVIAAPVVDAAISRHRSALLREVASEPAELIIAHHASALPPAARAARLLASRLAFDAEDLHVDELPDVSEHALDRAIIMATERRYLRRCDRVTASSPGIGEVLAQRYAIPLPETILNTFPAVDLPASVVGRGDGEPLSLYWFSQVIGVDRGIQDAIRALPLLRRPAELHLRGVLHDRARTVLSSLATELGVADAVHFQPLAKPSELVALAAEHDIGLALETGTTLNHQLCISNKLLLYFTAGIPVVATDLPGQRSVIEKAVGAGVLYRSGDHVALARAIDRLSASPAILAEAKSKARALGRGEFAWQAQAPRLVEYLMSNNEAAVAGSLPVTAS